MEEIGDEDFSSNIKTALDTFRSDTSNDNYKKALAEFNEFMAICHAIDHKAADDALTMNVK